MEKASEKPGVPANTLWKSSGGNTEVWEMTLTPSATSTHFSMPAKQNELSHASFEGSVLATSRPNGAGDDPDSVQVTANVMYN